MYFTRCLLFAFFSLSLSGCWLIYKPDITQGNILTPEKVHAIHSGMTPEQVVELLGNPVLVNVFDHKEMVYVYTIQPGHGKFSAQQLKIYFQEGVVTRYTYVSPNQPA